MIPWAPAEPSPLSATPTITDGPIKERPPFQVGDVVECRGWHGRMEPGVNPFGNSGRERLVLTDDMGIGYWYDPASDIVYASPRLSRESLHDGYQRASAHIDTGIYVNFDRRAWQAGGDRSYHVSRLKLDLVSRYLSPPSRASQDARPPLTARQDAEHKSQAQDARPPLTARQDAEPKKKILDIGCHVGLFVMLAQEAGFECRGIDVSAEAIRAGTSHLGLGGLTAGTLDEAGFENESFDGLVVWDVLEHVPDLMDLMEQCARVLRPCGFFFAQVPNHRGLTARLKTLASRVGLHGRRYPHFGFPWHLYHFSPRSLDLLVCRVGMAPVEIASFTHRTKDGSRPRGALAWVNRGIERLALSDYLYIVARRSAAGSLCLPARP